MHTDNCVLSVWFFKYFRWVLFFIRKSNAVGLFYIPVWLVAYWTGSTVVCTYLVVLDWLNSWLLNCLVSYHPKYH